MATASHPRGRIILILMALHGLLGVLVFVAGDDGLAMVLQSVYGPVGYVHPRVAAIVALAAILLLFLAEGPGWRPAIPFFVFSVLHIGWTLTFGSLFVIMTSSAMTAQYAVL